MTRSSSPEPTWDILIASIEARTLMLHYLLSELGRQLRRGVGVIVYRDNLEAGYGAKCQALIEASTAEYVSFIDDDDWVDGEYVGAIGMALAERPDYVGFNVLYLEDGVAQIPVLHSLSFGGWHNEPAALYRDISHLNPIRREIALLGRFGADRWADREWASGVRDSGRCVTERYIARNLYHYRHRTSDTFTSPRAPLGATQRIAQPDQFDFVRWLPEKGAACPRKQ